MEKTIEQDPQTLPEDIMRELAAIALARATDCLRVRDGKVELKKLTKQKAAAVAAIEKTAGGWKVKFYDKLKALELLGSQLGMFGGSQQQTVPENNLLEAILNSTQQEVNMDDLSEIQ